MTNLLSDNGISRVWRDRHWIYKRQPKYFTDNEFHALSTLEYTGYVPRSAQRVDVSTVRMEYIDSGLVTNAHKFMLHYELILTVLRHHSLRHDDLTIHSILVYNNFPVLIDWAESRTFDDPRPSKRPEGDAYWLKRTLEELCKET